MGWYDNVDVREKGGPCETGVRGGALYMSHLRHGTGRALILLGLVNVDDMDTQILAVLAGAVHDTSVDGGDLAAVGARHRGCKGSRAQRRGRGRPTGTHDDEDGHRDNDAATNSRSGDQRHIRGNCSSLGGRINDN